MRGQSVKILTELLLEKARKHISIVQPELASILERNKKVYRKALLPKHDIGSIFGMIVRSIIHQQLSMAAGSSIGRKVLSAAQVETFDDFSPEIALTLPTHAYRQAGTSMRKGEYIRGLAERFSTGDLRYVDWKSIPESDLENLLLKSNGVGLWTIQMLSMFQFGKMDVLPVGDNEVRNGIKSLFHLDYKPTVKEMEQLTENWRPYRSLGSFGLFLLSHESTVEKMSFSK